MEGVDGYHGQSMGGYIAGEYLTKKAKKIAASPVDSGSKAGTMRQRSKASKKLESQRCYVWRSDLIEVRDYSYRRLKSMTKLLDEKHYFDAYSRRGTNVRRSVANGTTAGRAIPKTLRSSATDMDIERTSSLRLSKQPSKRWRRCYKMG